MIERQFPAMQVFHQLKIASDVVLKNVLAWGPERQLRGLHMQSSLQCCPSPPIHLVGQNDLISTTDSLCGRD